MDIIRSSGSSGCPTWAVFLGLLFLAILFIVLQAWWLWFISVVESVLGHPLTLWNKFWTALILTLIVAFLLGWFINAVVE